jgi:signal transduction histidine kinase
MWQSTVAAQAIVDSLHNTIAVLDHDGNIIVVNEAWRRFAQKACPPDRLERTGIGMNYLQVCRDAQGISAELAVEASKGIEAVLQGTQSSFTLEYPCFSPMRQSWYLMQVTLLAQNNGAVVTHIDITERKHQELALQEANRRFEVSLGMASHELKTPLTGIRGNIELALRRLEKMDCQGREFRAAEDKTMQRLRHPLEQALQRVMTQDRMITDLLDASRIKANRLEMVMCPCDLVEIVCHAIDDAQFLAPDRTIHVHLPNRESIPIIADVDRIGQVVSNYLRNALKYSATDRPVEVFLTRNSATAQVSVQDEGPGLTPEEQQSVWECFHRVKGVEVLYDTGGGLGLGLYLCRTITEYHGGHVGVNSVKGKGSTFWCVLPLRLTHFYGTHEDEDEATS